VDITESRVLDRLREPAAQEVILEALRQAIDERTLVGGTATSEPKPLILSRTRPFLWSRELAIVRKSVFSAQPCDSGLEVQFCGFLDRCADVEAFAKLAREVRFSLEYRAEGGRLAYYYPDFVVRLDSGECLVVETKGVADLDVPHKDQRAIRWATDATAWSGVKWSYVRVDQGLFERYAPSLYTMRQLVDIIYERYRSEYLRTRPEPRRRSREELVGLMARIREKTRGTAGVDEEISKLRDDPRG
jgi:type III restriction enzyme